MHDSDWHDVMFIKKYNYLITLHSINVDFKTVFLNIQYTVDAIIYKKWLTTASTM